jgi:hypothetical protein
MDSFATVVNLCVCIGILNACMRARWSHTATARRGHNVQHLVSLASSANNTVAIRICDSQDACGGQQAHAKVVMLIVGHGTSLQVVKKSYHPHRDANVERQMVLHPCTDTMSCRFFGQIPHLQSCAPCGDALLFSLAKAWPKRPL